MITFHRILLAISCGLAFLLGAFNAGAQDIAQQKAVMAMAIGQPLEILIHIDVRELEV